MLTLMLTSLETRLFTLTVSLYKFVVIFLKIHLTAYCLEGHNKTNLNMRSSFA